MILDERNTINKIFCVTAVDKIRTVEQQHERQLKNELLAYGIDYKVEDIRPYGMRAKSKRARSNFLT